MKYCPVCKIEYSDKAQFCQKCEAHLLEKADKPKSIKTNYRGLLFACIGTGAFIIFIMAIYLVYSLVAK